MAFEIHVRQKNNTWHWKFMSDKKTTHGIGNSCQTKKQHMALEIYVRQKKQHMALEIHVRQKKQHMALEIHVRQKNNTWHWKFMSGTQIWRCLGLRDPKPTPLNNL
jgi:hypothetical protein